MRQAFLLLLKQRCYKIYIHAEYSLGEKGFKHLQTQTNKQKKTFPLAWFSRAGRHSVWLSKLFFIELISSLSNSILNSWEGKEENRNL